ncbi:MAG TPA: sulfotransferase [Chloroflexota bacterium]|nr:sulfotransferase [Chloroflexota bacterium]
MRNCLVLGSGRSGTSMVTGLLSKSGYYMGANLYPPRDRNPKGFFEDPEINFLNEDIMALSRSPLRRLLPDKLFYFQPRNGQQWLAVVPLGTPVRDTEAIRRRITAQVAHEPYCFKDPRFSYTLPAWRPHLRNTVFVCVFREPARTATSIVQGCKEQRYLRNLRFTYSYARAIEMWCSMYEHVLEEHRQEGEWLFLHYNQVLDGSAFPLLEHALGARVDAGFVDSGLKRTSKSGDPGPRAMRIYGELCTLAGYAEPPA